MATETSVKIVKIQSTNNLQLVADWREADSDIGILIVHGLTGTRREWGKFTTMAEAFHNQGWNVLNPDMSGSGDSDDHPVLPSQWEDDVRASLEFMRSNGVKKIGVVAASMGGLVALRVVPNQPDVITLVGLAPVSDHLKALKSELKKEMRILKTFGKVKVKVHDPKLPTRTHALATRQLVKELTDINQDQLLEPLQIPTFFLHGDRDKRVPLEFSQRAAETNGNITLKVIDGAGHAFSRHVEQVINESKNWFAKELTN